MNSPSAATAASKPSSSSPGISLLRLRLGGREPVGDTTAQTIWKKAKGMLIFKDSHLKFLKLFFNKIVLRSLRVATLKSV